MVEIPLTQDKVAFVDDEDYERVRGYRWYATWTGRGWYAAAKVESRLVYMHRLILGAQKGQTVDHVHGNGLDNRRSVIRLVSNRENSRNRRATNGYKGITRIKKGWKAQIWVEGKKLYLGTFETEIEAARAYDAAAKEYFGEFAWLNFPIGGR